MLKNPFLNPIPVDEKWLESTLWEHLPSSCRHESFWGAHWIDGLSPGEIDDLEKKWNISFPPDFRLFLEVLHIIDRPEVIEYEDFDSEIITYGKQTKITNFQPPLPKLWDGHPRMWGNFLRSLNRR